MLPLSQLSVYLCQDFSHNLDDVAMKRIFFLLLLSLISISLSAQTHVEIKRDRVFQDGRKLSGSQAVALFSNVNGIDLSDEYLKNRRCYRAGLGLIIGGSSLISAGALVMGGGAVSAAILGLPLALSGEDMPKGVDIALGTGCAAMIVGAAAVVAGVPTLCVFRSRLKTMGEEYNASTSQGAALTFGLQNNGVGFAMNF